MRDEGSEHAFFEVRVRSSPTEPVRLRYPEYIRNRKLAPPRGNDGGMIFLTKYKTHARDRQGRSLEDQAIILLSALAPSIGEGLTAYLVLQPSCRLRGKAVVMIR